MCIDVKSGIRNRSSFCLVRLLFVYLDFTSKRKKNPHILAFFEETQEKTLDTQQKIVHNKNNSDTSFASILSDSPVRA